MSNRLRLAFSLLFWAIPSVAIADGTPPPNSAGRRITVGPPAGYAAMQALDAERSRTTATVLGRTPHVSARLRLADGIAQGLVVSRSGTLVVVHSGVRLSEFDADGRPLYSLALPSEPSSAPIITSDELRVLLVNRELWGIARDGTVRYRTALSPALASPRPTHLLGTSAGGVLVAAGNKLFGVSAFGAVTASISLPDAIAELVHIGDGILAVTDSGSLFAIDAMFSARRVGSLGGPALAIASNRSARTLLARTGPGRLAAFDARSGETRTLPLEPGLTLDGAVLLTPESLAIAFETDGSRISFEPDGVVHQRLNLAFAGLGAPSSNALLLLGDGALLLTAQGRDAWLLPQSGSPLRIEDSACADPLGLYPTGPRSVVLACRSGIVLWLE